LKTNLKYLQRHFHKRWI